MNARGVLPFLVAVEADPLRFHGENPSRPEPLPARAAEQLVAHLGADLTKLFPEAANFDLCLCGGLYDQAQLMRPGWPIFDAMREVSRRRRQRQPETGMLSIGTADGQMPLGALMPDPELPPGMLLLMPLLLTGEPEALASLESEMEHRFMEEGQLSPHSARALEQAFELDSTHIRFLTLTDLSAMLKLQLEHFGFEVLWTLLDAALESADDTGWLSGQRGQRLRWDGQKVITRFETFDDWARHGAGATLAAAELGDRYTEWTREYRQLLVTLGAHGVAVEQQLQQQDDKGSTVLEGLFFTEDAGAVPGKAPTITEHSGEAMGTVAVTVVHEGRMSHYYPLAPEGSNALHAELATLELAHQGLSYPGRLCIDEATRRLCPDCDGAGQTPAAE